ncbi:MAG: hypothetical protein V4773_04235 [Verrucomicrobiota bacterium]
MALQLFAAIDPEGKDYIMLIVGFLLGYIASFCQTRYDRYRSLMDEACRITMEIHYHVMNAKNGIAGFMAPRTALNAVSVNLLLAGHTKARKVIEEAIPTMAFKVTNRCGETQALPAGHEILRPHHGNREAAGLYLAGLDLLKSRERWVAKFKATRPNLEVILPFFLRWLAPVVDEIETLCRWS